MTGFTRIIGLPFSANRMRLSRRWRRISFFCPVAADSAIMDGADRTNG